MEVQSVISPYEELIAYEILMASGYSTKKIINTISNNDTISVKNILDKDLSNKLFDEHDIRRNIEKHIESKIGTFSVVIKDQIQYPDTLKTANHPLGLLYYRGDLSLLNRRSVSVVGSRKPSDEGLRRAKKIVKKLVRENFNIVSGLARGIDTISHQTAIEENGTTIGVIGTPIDQYYPKENQSLQDYIAGNFLLLSQVPFYKYATEHFKAHRYHFPERNVTMSAISEATVIIEASDTSGTLIQARECLRQNRKLFILKSCFDNPRITWPHKYLERGAIKVEDFDDVIEALNK